MRDIKKLDTRDLNVPVSWEQVIQHPETRELGRLAVLMKTADMLANRSGLLDRLEIEGGMSYEEHEGGVLVHFEHEPPCFYYNAILAITPEYVNGQSHRTRTELIYAKDGVQQLQSSPFEYDELGF